MSSLSETKYTHIPVSRKNSCMPLVTTQPPSVLSPRHISLLFLARSLVFYLYLNSLETVVKDSCSVLQQEHTDLRAPIPAFTLSRAVHVKDLTDRALCVCMCLMHVSHTCVCVHVCDACVQCMSTVGKDAAFPCWKTPTCVLQRPSLTPITFSSDA